MTPKTPQENKALAQARTLKLLREKLADVEAAFNKCCISRKEFEAQLNTAQNALYLTKTTYEAEVILLKDRLDRANQQRDSTQLQYQSAYRREQSLILAHAQLKNEATMRLEQWGKHKLECNKRHRLGPCDCGFDGAKIFV